MTANLSIAQYTHKEMIFPASKDPFEEKAHSTSRGDLESSHTQVVTNMLMVQFFFRSLEVICMDASVLHQGGKHSYLLFSHSHRRQTQLFPVLSIIKETNTASLSSHPHKSIVAAGKAEMDIS